jgi:hypothetical protein
MYRQAAKQGPIQPSTPAGGAQAAHWGGLCPGELAVHPPRGDRGRAMPAYYYKDMVTQEVVSDDYNKVRDGMVRGMYFGSDADACLTADGKFARQAAPKAEGGLQGKVQASTTREGAGEGLTQASSDELWKCAHPGCTAGKDGGRCVFTTRGRDAAVTFRAAQQRYDPSGTAVPRRLLCGAAACVAWRTAQGGGAAEAAQQPPAPPAGPPPEVAARLREEGRAAAREAAEQQVQAERAAKEAAEQRAAQAEQDVAAARAAQLAAEQRAQAEHEAREAAEQRERALQEDIAALRTQLASPPVSPVSELGTEQQVACDGAAAAAAGAILTAGQPIEKRDAGAQGHGVFANQKLTSEDDLGAFYAGEFITARDGRAAFRGDSRLTPEGKVTREPDRDPEYVFQLKDGNFLDATMDTPANPRCLAAFVNHSSQPNCEFDDRLKLRVKDRHVIRVDEQLTIDYGEQWWGFVEGSQFSKGFGWNTEEDQQHISQIEEQRILRELNEEGITVIGTHTEHETHSQRLHNNVSDNLEEIFQTLPPSGQPDVGNGERRQASYRPQFQKDIQEKVQRVPPTKRHVLHGGQCVESLDGCPAQVLHFDYSNILKERIDQIEAGCKLYNVMYVPEGRQLRYVPGSHRERGQDTPSRVEPVTRTFQPGEIIMFDGDLLHSGAAWESANGDSNRCMHWFALPPTVKQQLSADDLNQTEGVEYESPTMIYKPDGTEVPVVDGSIQDTSPPPAPAPTNDRPARIVPPPPILYAGHRVMYGGEIHTVTEVNIGGSSQVRLHGVEQPLSPSAQGLKVLPGDGAVVQIPVDDPDFDAQIAQQTQLGYKVNLVCRTRPPVSQLTGAAIEPVPGKGNGVVARRHLNHGHVVLVEQTLLKCLYKNREALVTIVLAFPDQYGQLCATKSWTPTPGKFKELAGEGALQVNGEDVTAEPWSAAQSQVASNMFAGFMTTEAETTVYEPGQEIYLYQNGSAFNHDSEPNVEQKRDADGKMSFVTTESVAEGSELCIYYSSTEDEQFGRSVKRLRAQADVNTWRREWDENEDEGATPLAVEPTPQPEPEFESSRDEKLCDSVEPTTACHKCPRRHEWLLHQKA